MRCEFEDKLFTVDAAGFEALAIEVFRFQATHNPVYAQFVRALQVDPQQVSSTAQIPFLPIQTFKTHKVLTAGSDTDFYFESSGTTQTVQSRHFVRDLEIYRKSFLEAFKQFYGSPSDWVILGLLPSYLERKNSSLVMMVDALIRLSGKAESGFYLDEHRQLSELLKQLEINGRKTMLIGVAFGLLDFAAQYPADLRHTTVMETGGMKGRRKELIRDELHAILKEAFQVSTIHSEYGMTELLSQAYSKNDGLFETPQWMRVYVRPEDDPFQQLFSREKAVTGLINIIDLANVYSCSFIATEDVGRVHPDGRFEVLGRVDNSDIRGCSLLVM